MDGILCGELPPSVQKLAANIQVILLFLLFGAVAYAFMVSRGIEDTPSSLTDPESLPPSAVKLLEELADANLGDSITELETEVADEVQAAAKEMMLKKLHETSSQIAQRVEEDVRLKLMRAKLDIETRQAQEAKSHRSIDEVYDSLHVPYDLRFPDMKQFIEHNIKRATQDLVPRKKWEGPLDLDDLVDKRAKEIDEEWKARGSLENERPGYRIQGWHFMPPLPYQIIGDLRGKETGVLGVSCPYGDEYWMGERERGAFWWLKNAGYIAVGISSFEHFPSEIINPHDGRHVHYNPDDWPLYEALDGFLHCFRDPDYYLPKAVPRVLISESDFVSWETLGAKVLPPEEKKWDFLYVNNGNAWNDYNRNWTVAKECIKIMMDMGLKVVTTRPCDDTPELKPYIDNGQLTINPFSPYNDFLNVLKQARAMFTPCVADASPRSATEAMSMNLPVLMNWNIVGGWKYINDKTGVFFHDHHDVRAAIEKLFSPEFQAGLAPRQWVMENLGAYKSALRLQAFLELTVGKDRLAAARKERESHHPCDPQQPGTCK